MHFEKRTSVFKDLGFREAALPGLKAYIDALWKANEELNLISRKMTYEELIDNHVIDCLLPLAHFPEGVKAAADFGAGGGLPGVIYALQFPEMIYHLYEKSPKKQEFLTSCRKFAPNLKIHGEIPKDLPGIDVVSARGFKPVDVILGVSRSFHRAGGKYFLLKARREKIDEELVLARNKFKDLKPEIIPLKSPVLEVERHLVRF
jgi:16S rRNA (guanine527-N7)-methyltransferase